MYYNIYKNNKEIFRYLLKQKGGNYKLYTDDNPSTTIKGTGYVNKKKALQTLKLIEKRSINYQKSVVNTMLYRAKHHKNKTPDMEEAIKIFKSWMDKNKNKKRKYEYLDLKTIIAYEKLADEYGVSEVTRGIKKANKSDNGFLVIYKKHKGNKGKMSFIPVKKSKPEGQDYDSMRESFLNSRLGQIKHAKTKLYYTDGKYKGLPTKQHIIMIMNAYSPEPKKIKKLKKNI